MNDELKAGVKRLFEILDTKESNEDGTKEFNPTYIVSSRVRVSAELYELLPRLRKLANS